MKLATLNRDPAAAVHEKTLREDLYYRLNVVPIILPPLRERDGDIALLSNYMLRRFARQYGKRFQSIDESALGVLEAYEWPGNVRQLLHLIQRVVILNDGETLSSPMLPREIFRETQPSYKTALTETTTLAPSSPGPFPTPLSSSASAVGIMPVFATKSEIVPLEEIERRAISRAIELCNESAYEAARLLGISSATIYRKIKLYGLTLN